jgi:hypothetical protein
MLTGKTAGPQLYRAIMGDCNNIPTICRIHTKINTRKAKITWTQKTCAIYNIIGAIYSTGRKK